MEVIIDGIVYVPKETKTEIEYPIFKRNKDGEVFKFVSHKGTLEFTNIFTKIPLVDISITNPTLTTIPYDSERGLYHLQPVWCWNNTHTKRTGFYRVDSQHVIFDILGHITSFFNIEPITPEQLKVMPFIWDMYQQVLKDNK